MRVVFIMGLVPDKQRLGSYETNRGRGTGPQSGLFCWMETLDDQPQDQPDKGLPEGLSNEERTAYS